MGKAKILQSGGGLKYKGSNPITPGKSNIVIPKNTLLGADLTIKGDSNLVAGNIKSGKSIFGVSGNMADFETGTSVVSGHSTKEVEISHSLGRTPGHTAILYEEHSESNLVSEVSYTSCSVVSVFDTTICCVYYNINNSKPWIEIRTFKSDGALTVTLSTTSVKFTLNTKNKNSKEWLYHFTTGKYRYIFW